MKNSIKLNSLVILLALIATILMANFACAADSIVKIGVLAKRGPERCVEKWSPTAEYLNNKIPGKTFVIVPVAFDQIYSVVEKAEVDFLLANPSFYVELESCCEISRIATLKNKVFDGIHTTYGGVVFCKKQREDIRQYADLKRKTFMAVKDASFGGWRMAWREFKETGIDPFKDFASISFGGTHDAVIYAVRDGKVDAGTVRTDTLERMDTEGKIRMDDFYIIHEHGGGNVHLPFWHSTREYPEWPIAKLKSTSTEVAKKVAVALINMPQDAAAAQAAKSAGWAIPLNYQPVHDCLKELKVGPYKDLGKIMLTDVFRKYWILILINFATLVVLAWFLGTHIIMNRKIRTTNKKLRFEVNERIQAEKALVESEERYTALFERSLELVYLFDFEGNFIDANNAALEELGYTRKDIKSLNFMSLLGKDQLPHALESMEEIMKTGSQRDVTEYKLKRKDGRHIYVESKAALIYRDGRPVAIQGIGRNITGRKLAEKALKESEEKYRVMMEAIKEPVYICSSEFRVEYTNPTMIQRIGRDATGEFCFKAINDLDQKCPWCMHHKTQANEYVESDIVSPKDNRSYHTSQTPVVNGDGSISNMTILRDTTDWLNLESQLRHSQKMEAIGVLAGGVAHDFNNILTVIIGNAQLALMDIGQDGSLREEIEEIKTAGEKAASLIRQLMAFSRKQIVQPKILDFNELLAGMEKMLGRLLRENIEPLTIPGPGLLQVDADPGQMEQVIMNLVVNARDAMPKGGNLTVETANIKLDESYFRKHGIQKEKSGTYVVLSVSDTGIGMDKETQKHIFEPFYTTKEIGQGTGLGLSTIYGIVKQSHGFIWVYSEPGQGSTFKVYLPKAKGDVKPIEEKPIPVSELGGSETILIVEDDDGLRKFAQTVLRKSGYKVLEAENGEDALRISAAHDGSIDLLITDVVMPKMGGKEIAKRLQSLYPRMKVLYMSGYTGNAIVHDGVLATGLNFIEKPFSRENFTGKVREILDTE